MSKAKIKEYLTTGEQAKANELARQLWRQRQVRIHENCDAEPRILHLIAIDHLTVRLDRSGERVLFGVDGHWEAEHFLLGRGYGTITAMIVEDTNPDILVELLKKTNRQIVVNCIADPDLFPGSLEVARRFEEQIDLPVINPACRIMAHSRDGVANALAGIEGLRVPQTVKVHVASDIAPPMEYPFLGRLCGTQTGDTLVLIESAAHFADFVRYHNRSNAYFTEFVDFRSEDSLYRKYRVRVIGDQIVANHMFINPDWKVHGHSSRRFMSENPALLKEERRFMASPLKHRLPLQRIVEKTGVDFFGIDFGETSNGTPVLFEANAAMRSIYPEWRETYPETWHATNDLVERFSMHLKQKLRTC